MTSATQKRANFLAQRMLGQVFCHLFTSHLCNSSNRRRTSTTNNVPFLSKVKAMNGSKISSTSKTIVAFQSSILVKTLHPNIHGGILARKDQKHHMEALNKHGIGTFDLVVVNLYPFYDKVSSSSGITFEDGIENIDISGPDMIRAAAKNHTDILVVVDSEDYLALLEFLNGNQDDQNFRRSLHGRLFSMLLLMIRQFQNAVEANRGRKCLIRSNNYLDVDAAWNCTCISEFQNPTCVVVKHTNPCGVASRDDILEAYRLAVKARRSSESMHLVGYIVAFNVEVNEVVTEESEKQRKYVFFLDFVYMLYILIR